MTLQQYIDNINQRFLLRNATKHNSRGDLQQLLESLVSEQSLDITRDHAPLPINRTPNLNPIIVNKIAQKLGLTFVPEPFDSAQNGNGNVCFANNNDELQDAYKQTFAPIDLLDYIYAVLHSPTYRDKYKEFLKIDFSKVSYPKDTDTFWQLVKLGGKIREIHLLESLVVENYITSYPQDGDNMVVKARYINPSPLEGYLQDAVNSPPLERCPQDGVVEIFINNTKITLNPKLELPYNAHLKERAKKLRQAKNLPEVLFWMQVHKKKFHKIDFDRQRVIGYYIVDFYVKKLGLVIEIDGSSHKGKEKYDAEREAYLISEGLKVYRIQVVDVMKNMSSVLIDLEKYIIENYGNLENSKESKRFFSHSEKPPRLLGTPPKEGNLGAVYINDNQYFADVPLVAWEFYIGGYQPAQKWLKDRKGRTLTFEDILHYQKIIGTLTETDRLMKAIAKIKIE